MSPNVHAEETPGAKEFQHFLDGAVHGLRGPLRGIATSAALLSQKWNDRLDEEGRCLVRSILDGVGALGSLTKAVADYSMALVPQRSISTPLPIENAVRSAMAALREKIEETRAEIHFRDLPRVAADHEQMNVLFRCLLTNALENSGGATPRIEITATQAGDEWRFAVGDNGVGIAQAFHRKIFEPFERLHSSRGNFGLGLAICRKIVSAHGGRMWVVSQEGDGSTFFFTLPANAAGR